MRINEILKIDTHEEYVAGYAYHFNNPTDQHVMPPHANNLELNQHWVFKISIDTDQIHLSSWDGPHIISYVGLHKFMDGYQVDMIATDPKYRSRGLIRYAINYAVGKWHKIYSDTRQTPDAQAVWTALILRPFGTTYQLYDLGHNTLQQLRVVDGQIVPNPWSEFEEDTVILATSTVLSETTLKVQVDRILLDTQRHRRWAGLGLNFTDFIP